MKFNKLILASAVSIALAACGGGSDSNSATTTPPVQTSPVSVVFSGTAAVGAPLEGSVTVKDSKGATKVAQIGTNGAYSVDVTGMTGPFVFRASGSANGHPYTVHSIATSADAAGKVNITQLTDLIAANVGGQVAADYFDQFDKNAASATASSIDAEAAKLKEKLQAILTALGVDANADLLRTPFVPLASPLDKALDAIHVSVDTGTAVATISTTANTSVITDDLKQKAAAETSPAKLGADNIATVTTDAPLVKKALTDFIAQFANGAPAALALSAMVDKDFLQDDMIATDYFRWMVTEPTLVGGSLTDIDIHRIDYSDPNKITAHVSFTLKSKDGHVLDRMENWKVRKTDGGWRLQGNQRVLDVRASVVMSKTVGASGTCFRTGLDFDISDRNSANNTAGTAIDHIIITGPGLPADGLRYNNLNSPWQNTVSNDTGYVMGTDCAGATSRVGDDGIARIPDNAAYVLTAYSAANAKLNFASGSSDGTYVVKMQRRPLTLAEAKASTGFASVSDQTLAALSTFTGGTFAVAGSNANPGTDIWLLLALRTAPNGWAHDEEATVLPNAAGAFSASIQLAPLQSTDVITSRSLRMELFDQYRRNMVTVYNR